MFFIWLKLFTLIELMGVNENVGGLILALSFSERAGWLIASSPSIVGLQFVFIDRLRIHNYDNSFSLFLLCSL